MLKVLKLLKICFMKDLTEDMNNVDLEGSLSRPSLAGVSLSHYVTNVSAGFELVARIVGGY